MEKGLGDEDLYRTAMSHVNIANVGYDSTNYYVIAGPQKTTLLVDVGFPGTLPKLQHECKRMGVDLTRIPYLFCTHYHPDHAGLAQELKVTGTQLIITDIQLAVLEANLAEPKSGFVQPRLDDNTVVPLDVSRDFLRRLGLEGELISTSGHSEDSVTLVLDEGIAFTGDLGHPLLMADNPIITASWQKILALGVRTIYPGHGPSWLVKQFFPDVKE
jgi:glyoxylase-like metal-dependent hydrolase (beta-lactamase superfamily II)